MKKTVNVVAAIIIENNMVFCCERGYGKYKGGWEFPGGKIEENEKPEDAIIREIKEELNMDIEVKEYFMDVDEEYEEFYLNMKCFICSRITDSFALLEHKDCKWLKKEELYSVDWLKADRIIVDRLYGLLS